MPDPRGDEFDGFFRGFGILFAISAIASLALTGVVIWAIVALISHFT